MSDISFLLYFVAKFYAGTLLLSIAAVAILFAVVLRSFRVFLWSAVTLAIALNAWLVLFVFLQI